MLYVANYVWILQKHWNDGKWKYARGSLSFTPHITDSAHVVLLWTITLDDDDLCVFICRCDQNYNWRASYNRRIFQRSTSLGHLIRKRSKRLYSSNSESVWFSCIFISLIPDKPRFITSIRKIVLWVIPKIFMIVLAV